MFQSNSFFYKVLTSCQTKSHSIVLFGYDTGLGGGVVAQPAFLHDMGIAHLGKTELADLKANIVSILQGGSFFGALGAAPLSNYIGRKYSLLIGCAIFAVGVSTHT